VFFLLDLLNIGHSSGLAARRKQQLAAGGLATQFPRPAPATWLQSLPGPARLLSRLLLRLELRLLLLLLLLLPVS
jgi:hypothetical protein